MALDFGVCRLTMVPVFENPEYHSRQHNQLLFGESYEVTGKKGDWISIVTAFDNEGGWILTSQHHSITKEYFDQINSSDYKITTDTSATLLYNKNPLTVVMGSIVPISSSELFKMEEQLAFNGETKSMSQKRDGEFLKSVLKKFANTPFIPGSKTPFGSDNSGYIQMSFKVAGYRVPRFSENWASLGTKVENLDAASIGDLFLMKGPSGITPAVYLAEANVMMMSGFVQAFKVDSKGIKLPTQKKYSYELLEIRRVIH